MGVFVATAFLTGILGKVAHRMWLRKKNVVTNESGTLGEEKKPAGQHGRSAKKR